MGGKAGNTGGFGSRFGAQTGGGMTNGRPPMGGSAQPMPMPTPGAGFNPGLSRPGFQRPPGEVGNGLPGSGNGFGSGGMSPPAFGNSGGGYQYPNMGAESGSGGVRTGFGGSPSFGGGGYQTLDMGRAPGSGGVRAPGGGPAYFGGGGGGYQYPNMGVEAGSGGVRGPGGGPAYFGGQFPGQIGDVSLLGGSGPAGGMPAYLGGGEFADNPMPGNGAPGMTGGPLPSYGAGGGVGASFQPGTDFSAYNGPLSTPNMTPNAITRRRPGNGGGYSFG